MAIWLILKKRSERNENCRKKGAKIFERFCEICIWYKGEYIKGRQNENSYFLIAVFHLLSNKLN